MKKMIIALALVLIATTGIWGANFQKVYEIGDPVYKELKALYLEAGMAPPSSSGPWTSGEIVTMLNSLDRKNLSPEGRQRLRQLAASLDIPELKQADFAGSIKAYPIFEMYLHTNSDDYRLDSDWGYDYDDRRPLIDIPIESFITDYIYSTTDLAILKTRFSRNQSSGNALDSSEIYSPEFNTNFPFDENIVGHIDLNFPERALVSVGFGKLNLTFGRDDLFWGSGHTGSLTVGDHLDYYDFARFTSNLDDFKYTFLLAGFDSPSWTNSSQNSTPDDDDATSPAGDSDNIKLYAAHRFEFSFLRDKLNFNLTEGMIYQSSSIDFRYLNPALFWHNLFIRGNANSTLALELEANPWKYINLYGTMLLDEFPYPGEDQTSPGAHPNGIGMLGGLECLYPIGPGLVTGWFEYAQTDPFLYLRDDVDYIVNRRIFNMESGFIIDRNFMGYEYGNDVIVLGGGLEYDWFDKISAQVSILSMSHGENSMDTVWGTGPDNVNQTTPWDDPLTPETVEQTLMVSIGGDINPFRILEFTPLEGLGIRARCDIISHQNKDNTAGNDTQDVQITLGVSFSY